MIRTGFFRAALVCFWVFAGVAGARADEAPKPPADTVRPEVGKPIQAARELIQAKKYKDALAKAREADAVPNLTAYEKFAIDLTRGSAAQGSGDTEVAISSFESAVASGRLPAAAQLEVIGAIAELNYQAKNYAKAIAWAERYEKDGGTDPALRQVRTQAYYLSGDYASAAKDIKADIEADERADRKPTEERLQLLASCYLKLNDNAGYASVLEKLVAHYPKKNYWLDLIFRTQRRPGFSDRLALDVYRIQLVTGNLSKPTDFMIMAELALQAGFPAEAKKILDQGYASGTLGKGAEADRQNRLRDLANRQAAQDAKSIAQGDSEIDAAKDGDALVTIGYNYFVNGQVDRGLAIMEQAVRKNALKRPEDAKLHLGLAYVQAGQKAKAQQILQTVRGNDGTADLARLWLLQAGKSA